MENYKIESYDYRTFERKDLETNVSRNLVNHLNRVEVLDDNSGDVF